MKELLMYIGLPASGKSTLAKEQEKLGYIHLSSDNLRLQYPDKNNAEIFQLMNKLTISHLNNNEKVIYDATNLSAKYRIATISTFKKALNDLHITAVLFVTPLEICIARNEKRPSDTKVPISVYARMLKSFQPPSYNEGFERITFAQTETRTETIEEVFSKCETFSQKNPHHPIDILSEHLQAVTDGIVLDPSLSLSDREILSDLAIIHDIGKLETFSIDESGVGHFYGHANVGSYMYLSLKDTELNDKSLFLAQLIALHMRAFEYKKNTALIDTDKKKYGNEIIRLITLFNKYDEEFA